MCVVFKATSLIQSQNELPHVPYPTLQLRSRVDVIAAAVVAAVRGVIIGEAGE
jgi:hypothetical protein